MVPLNLSDRPVTPPMLTWTILSAVHIQRIQTRVWIKLGRDCGQRTHVIQTPLQFDLRVAADVKYSARIKTQRLIWDDPQRTSKSLLEDPSDRTQYETPQEIYPLLV